MKRESTKYFVRSSSAGSQIVWRKDSLVLKKGTGRSFRKMNEEARVIVDTFSTLYLMGNLALRIYAGLLDLTREIAVSNTLVHLFKRVMKFDFFFLYCVLTSRFLSTDVSAKEQGNYTCYVDNVNMMRVKIIVVSKPRLLTQGQSKLIIANGMYVRMITKYIINM